MKTWEQFLTENAIANILSDIPNNNNKTIVSNILVHHPDWVQSIMQFKQDRPAEYRKSVENFKDNTANEELIAKLANGQILGYYDFM